MTAEARERLRADLIRDEGLRNTFYVDSLGYASIGVGRLIDDRKGDGLSDQECYLLLDNDVGKTVRALTARFRWFDRLDDVRQTVIANMAFNLGVDGLAAFTQTIAAIERRDYEAAAAEMLRSKWSQQVGLRAIRLAQQLRSGKW